MRYALAIEYNGSQFCGWQRQKHCKSVQSVLETALSRVADETIELTCSGRTDAGVHAISQVAHFDTDVMRSDKAWLMGSNTHLDSMVSVHWVKRVSEDFHARYSAESRRYRYIILNRVARPALEVGRIAWQSQKLDENAMNLAAQYLVGEFDFSAFRASGCQAKHAIREIKSLRVYRKNEKEPVDICANAFLHNMVRIIVGSLIAVGKGEEKPEWLLTLLQGKDRTLSGTTDMSEGLYFVGPKYPCKYMIPEFC